MRGNGDTIGLDQRQVTAAGADLEVGVKFLAGHGQVIIRGENHHIPAGRDRHVRGGTGICIRESPFRQIAGVVGQVPTIQGLNSVGRIVDLDPIGVLAELVHQRGAVVRCHELRNIKRTAVKQPAGFKRFQAQATAKLVFSRAALPLAPSSLPP